MTAIDLVGQLSFHTMQFLPFILRLPAVRPVALEPYSLEEPFMTALDYVVLALYFAAMTLIGVLSMLKVKKQEDFFLGSRTFGKVLQTFAAFGAGTGSYDPVAVGLSRARFNAR